MTRKRALLLQAEMMELKARVDGTTQAYVVEARLDRGRGPLTTAIVKAGIWFVDKLWLWAHSGVR